MYDLEIINKLGIQLSIARQTIAVAESVTSGHLQAALSLADQATFFYQGGITTYNIVQKYTHLHIAPTHAISCNCVSEKIAEEMAVNVCALFSSDWGIAITGYASPIPEARLKDIYACYAFAFKGEAIRTGIVAATESDPLQVQLFYTNQLLKELLAVVYDHVHSVA